MKRLATFAGLAFASLIGAFTFTAPAHAAFSCTTPTVSAGAYPQNYLWFCEDPMDSSTTLQALTKTDSTDALQRLGNNSTSASDAKTKMSTNKHYVYIFRSQTTYGTYATGTGNIGSTPPVPKKFTFTDIAQSQKWDPGTGIIQQSIVIEDDVLANSAHTNIANTTAHEAGHQLDGIYGDVLYAPASINNFASIFTREYAFKLTGETVTFAGATPLAGDTMSLGFEQATGSPIVITRNAVAGESSAAIALDFESKINNVANGLTALGVHATASSATLKITSDTIFKYTQSKTGSGHTVITLTIYDWQAFITSPTPQCSRGQGLFNTFKDANGNQICGSLQQGVVGGSSFAGEFVQVKVTDNAINNGGFNFKTVAGPVGAGFTTTQIAAQLATNINNDTTLNPSTPKRFTATSSGANVYITSSTGNTTTYVFSVSGTHETFAASGGTTAGSGEQTMNTYAGLRNDKVLQQAWPYYFLSQTTGGGDKLWAELFAEQSAIRAGKIMSGAQTPDNWIGPGEFICSNKVVEKLGVSGALPASTDYATQCK